VGPLNWTQSHEHKSVWDGPASKATGHAPRPARDWPVPLSYHRPARTQASWRTRTPLRKPALVARTDFLKIGHFAPFSQFYTLTVCQGQWKWYRLIDRINLKLHRVRKKGSTLLLPITSFSDRLSRTFVEKRW